MPKGATIIDINDAAYECDICNKVFVGSQASIGIRLRHHYKLIHKLVGGPVMWAKAGRTTHCDKSQLCTNNMRYSNVYDNSELERTLYGDLMTRM